MKFWNWGPKKICYNLRSVTFCSSTNGHVLYYALQYLLHIQYCSLYTMLDILYCTDQLPLFCSFSAFCYVYRNICMCASCRSYIRAEMKEKSKMVAWGRLSAVYRVIYPTIVFGMECSSLSAQCNSFLQYTVYSEHTVDCLLSRAFLVLCRAGNSLVGFLIESLVFCEKMSDLSESLQVAHFW